MGIWFAPFTLEDLNRALDAGLPAALGIRFSGAGEDWLAATMPVDERSCQPLGLLHGGASFALAETVGGAAAQRCVDATRRRCLVREISGNHIRAMAGGLVTATARPQHLGARSQVWQVELRDPQARLVCVARLTVAVIAAT